MKNRNKLLLALGAIALGSTAGAGRAAAQDADGDYQSQCNWLANQSDEALQRYIEGNLDNPCAEVAAVLLAERSQPAAGVRAIRMTGRY